jgi:serine/threonine protein kinase
MPGLFTGGSSGSYYKLDFECHCIHASKEYSPSGLYVGLLRRVLQFYGLISHTWILVLPVKFENVLFANNSPQAEIKLIDFGLSTKFREDNNHVLSDGVGTVCTLQVFVVCGN